MDDSEQGLVLLRAVLDNLDQPEKLDAHPWASSRMVVEAGERNPGLKKLAPGERLVQTISSIFRMMMPNMPPRRGLRLDTHWGEFGILASQYFAPLVFNLPHPGSLREAWQNIDQAILLFVFNDDKDITDEDRIRYQLIGNEPEIAPNSTISDWHRKGIEQFSNFISQYIKQSDINGKIKGAPLNKQSPIIQFLKRLKPTRMFWVWFFRILLLLMVGSLAAGIWKGRELYQKASSLKQQAEEILVIYQSSPDLDKVPEISSRVTRLRTGLESLQRDAIPLLNISKFFKWVPVYGGDISQAHYLVEMIVQMSVTGDEVLKAVSPLLSVNNDDNSSPGILDLLSKLKNADSELLAAQVAFAEVQAARQKIQTDILSRNVNQLFNKYIDPLILSVNTAFPVTDVLQMARLAPRLLGAVGNGLQSYMILIQNEDELRPTGGFLTAVGLLEVENGKILNLSFESSEMVDDLSKPYPKSPWQLDDYMMSEILLFRDSNWFTNFPTTVEWAKFLYSYTRPKEVDGVISIDQHVVEELLKIVGPIDVIGVKEPISAGNLLTYMRSAKENKPPAGISKRDWDRKQFISWLADPLINKLLAGNSQNWKSLSQLLIQLLDEKHILLQSNDPEMSALLAKHGWDGAVRAEPNSDFLMVVDSNIGFNKTNALMQTEIVYAVDLADTNRPTADLTLTLINNSRAIPGASADCIQLGTDLNELPLDQREYVMQDCYWTYLRVYSPVETKLISSTPQEIPQKWPLREQIIPARTDTLDEGIDGAQAFGTLLVVPQGQTHQTSFNYQLPAAVVTTEKDGKIFKYTLKIQKQPGTLAVPLTFHLILPPGMAIKNAPAGLLQTQQAREEWIMETNLKEDALIEISFQPVE